MAATPWTASIGGRWRRYTMIFPRCYSPWNGSILSSEGFLTRSRTKTLLLKRLFPSGQKQMFSGSPMFFLSLTGEEEMFIDRLATDLLSIDNDCCTDDKNSAVSPSSNATTKRIALAKAITLVESTCPRKRLMADMLLTKLKRSQSAAATATTSFRLGIAGPPGVGKSSFVEAFGTYILSLTEQKDPQNRIGSSFQPNKLAVLCIDPSSHVSGGSILGDKTRMALLSHHPNAYIRPSPSSGTLGGLGSYTYDAASLCEIAGYQLTFIETVGVGQSEVELMECCDLFLLILAPGGGDELQGYKKGIVEVADVLVVNKSDGETRNIARKTANDYKNAIGLLRKPVEWWGDKGTPPVLMVSAKTGSGMKELWDIITKYQQYADLSGLHMKKRRNQNRYWMWKYLQGHVLETALSDKRVKTKKDEIERSLDSGFVAPRVAAAQLWRSIVGDTHSEDKQ